MSGRGPTRAKPEPGVSFAFIRKIAKCALVVGLAARGGGATERHVPLPLSLVHGMG